MKHQKIIDPGKTYFENIGIMKVGSTDPTLTSGERGMLVVGTNVYLSEKMSHSFRQAWDTFLVFHPNPEAIYKVSIVCIARVVDAAFCVVSQAPKIQDAVEGLFESLNRSVIDSSYHEVRPKIKQWINLAAYKLPKIALKEILHLEPYKEGVKNEEAK